MTGRESGISGTMTVMATGISGRTAVLTGAGKLTGLGHAFAMGLAKCGANVVVADIVEGAESVAHIKALGGRAVYVHCDVSKEADVKRLAYTVEAEFGGCDILVHGASPFRHKIIDEMSLADWHQVVSANLDGMFMLAHAFVPGMKARRWGRIIPISSASVQHGTGGRTNYMTAKAGLIGFARSLARETGNFGITVNVLSPGLVRTERGHETALTDAAFAGRDKYDLMRELQSIGETLVPDNLVGPLLFLASDDSAYVTGQTLLVDAGWQHL